MNSRFAKCKLKNLLAGCVCVLFLSLNAFSQSTHDVFSFNYEGENLKIEEILSKYIQIKSVSGSEKEAGEFIKSVCLQNGLSITQMGNTNGNYNFAASLKPLTENLPNIIFLNHIDVVEEGDLSNWKYPPYSGKIDSTDVWGRGAYDNKGAAIMQLASIIETKRKFNHKDLPYNVTFLAVSCEETQCEGGVKYVIDNYLKLLNPIVVIGEGPSELTPILNQGKLTSERIFGISVAHKRAFWLKLELEINTIGHGSVTPLKYANKEMVVALNNLLKKKEKTIYNEVNVEMLKELGKFEKGISSFVLRHPRLFKGLIVPKLRKQPELFALFSNTITLTNVNSSSNVINVVPNKVTALLDCRLLPNESEKKFLNMVQKRLKNNAIKISVLTKMPRMEALDETNLFYQNFKSSLKQKYGDCRVLKIIIPNFNDVGAFRSKGVSGFSVAPIKLERDYLKSIHNFNERVPIKELENGKNVYSHFLMKCLNKE